MLRSQSREPQTATILIRLASGHARTLLSAEYFYAEGAFLFTLQVLPIFRSAMRKLIWNAFESLCRTFLKDEVACIRGGN